MSEPANCFFCGDKVTLDRIGSQRAVLCVNPSCGAQGPLRDRRCDAIDAWNGVATRLGMPVPTQDIPMLFVRAKPFDLTTQQCYDL
jgi:hypothetical protein